MREETRVAQQHTAPAPAPAPAPASRWIRVLSSLVAEEPAVLVGPNWFASAMGTGILANAGALLPVTFPGQTAITTFFWVLSAIILIGLTISVPLHWLRTPGAWRRIVDDPALVQFFGAPPMAFMTVGTATLVVGQHWLDETAAVNIDWVLWTIGTILGLATAVLVPYRLFTQLDVRHDGAFGGWLMPVVPPMVSAASGALLVPYAPAGELRQTMLMACYAMFGMSLIVSIIIITLIWSRLAHFGSSGSARVPTLWIVLGPVGQSITAAGALGFSAATAVAVPLATALNLFAIMYGVPMWGFMLLWMCLATLLTVRALRRKMPFALTWWSFTFPIGTCVTGTSQLAKHTGLSIFVAFSVVLFALLLLAWVAVAIQTWRGSRSGGPLLTPPLNPPPAVASKG